MHILSFQTDSRAGSLSSARRRVRDAMTQARVDDESARDMEVAVGEALSNAHRHAYGKAVGPVAVRVDHTESAVTVVVTDEGSTTVPATVPTALPAHTPQGGRGLYLIRSLLDEVEMGVNPIGHGISIRMTRHIEKAVKKSQ